MASEASYQLSGQTMSWNNLIIEANSHITDQLSEALEAFLALSVTTENAGKDDFYEVAFPGKPDWQIVKISALFDENVDVGPIIAFLQKQFDHNINKRIECQRLEDQDWNAKWLETFKPVHVGDNLWVCPSWCDPVAPDARNIILDPGMAFGTGTHPTTNMVLDWLSRQQLTGKTVLDYGSGSGILAIAALFSDASKATAVDIDPLAVTACEENAKKNKVTEKLDCLLPAQLPSSTYDIVIANILADVIIELQSVLLSCLAPNGTLLLTGILTEQADKVRAAYPLFKFHCITQQEWCMLFGTPFEH